ncbi:hypothetical protein SV7mr_18780 [Stieleria bergensis]|uniref:Uncharacterized protein n=1 Tax=Stieleria bergensis TaxID=2528025 RepID=A0A517STC1_9BACT|nr:hypothetical protein SV7mr_18780 [Planctomycetes bacterium SV_7m_r]
MESFFESQFYDPGLIRVSTRLPPHWNAPGRAAATVNGTQAGAAPARSFHDLSLRAHRVLRGSIAEALPRPHRVAWNLNDVGCRACHSGMCQRLCDTFAIRSHVLRYR